MLPVDNNSSFYHSISPWGVCLMLYIVYASSFDKTLSWSKKSKTFLRCHTRLWCDLCPCLIFNRLIKRVRAVSVECDLRNPECKLLSKSLLTHIDVQLMVNMLPTNQKSKGNCFTMSKNGINKKARLMQIMPKAPNNLGSNYLITKPDKNLSIISPAENLAMAFLYYYLNHTRNTKDILCCIVSRWDSFKIKFHFFTSWHIKIFIQMIEKKIKLLFSISENL